MYDPFKWADNFTSEEEFMAKYGYQGTPMHKIAHDNFVSEVTQQIKKLEKYSLISEDELKRYSDEVQKLTDKFIANIDTLAKEKEQAIMAF